MRTARAASCFALLMLAGCVESGSFGLDTVPLPSGTAPPPPTPIDLRLDGNDCDGAAVVVLMDYTAIDPWLPRGYHAADVQTLFPQMPAPVGRGAFFLASFRCASFEFAPGEYNSTLAALLVSTPEVGANLKNSTVDLYLLNFWTGSGNLSHAVEPAAFSVNTSQVQVELTPDEGGMAPVGFGRTDTDGTMLAQFRTFPHAQLDYSNTLARFWHSDERGTTHLDYEFTTRLWAGSGVCDVAAGSLLAEVLGDTQCPAADTLSAALPNFSFHSSLQFLPGVWPR